jgi:hypothetical protein
MSYTRNDAAYDFDHSIGLGCPRPGHGNHFRADVAWSNREGSDQLTRKERNEQLYREAMTALGLGFDIATEE